MKTNKEKPSLQLRPMQKTMYLHGMEHKKAMLAADMGTGKTSAVLAILKLHRILNGWGKCLIVAPLRVARNTWQTEIEKWRDFQEFTYTTVIGTQKDKITGLSKHADFYITNYESLGFIYKYYDGLLWPFDVIILDESTRIKSLSASVSKKVDGKTMVSYGNSKNSYNRKLAEILLKKQPDYVYALTGTPVPNGFADLWGQIWTLDFGKRLGRTRSFFEGRYFTMRGVDASKSKKVPIDPSGKEILSLISDIAISIKKEDYFTLDKEVITDIEAELDEEAMKLYKELEKKLVLDIIQHGAKISTENAQKLRQCLMQLANGAVYVDDYEVMDSAKLFEAYNRRYAVIHDFKLDILESLIEENNGDNLIVCYQFKHDLDRLLRRFSQGVALNDRKIDAENLFKQGEIPLLFLHPGSAGHGIDGFQNVCNKMVFFGHNYSFDTRTQAIARIGPMRLYQSGINKICQVFNIVAKGTIDDDILDSINGKKSDNQAAMDFLTRKIKEYE